MIRQIFKSVFRPFYNRLRNLRSNVNLQIEYPSLKLGDKVNIHASKFGDNVYLASNSTINSSSFGDFSYCGELTSISQTTIGRFTCIGPNVKIGLGRHPLVDFVSLHPTFYSTAAQVGKTFVREQLFEEIPLPTSIGCDVWIGANVVIPGGVTIGNGAVIASGAIVTSNIAPYSIVGGVPAKHIKFRFNSDQIQNLLSIQWWDWPLETISARVEEFAQLDAFIDRYKTR